MTTQTVKVTIRQVRNALWPRKSTWFERLVADTFGVPLGLIQLGDVPGELYWEIRVRMLREIAFYGKHLPPAPDEEQHHAS